MGEGTGHRVVVAVGSGSLSHMLGEEIRRLGLLCELVVTDPPPVESKPVAAATRISVILARSMTGEIRTYPAAENLYEDGLLRTTIVPARVDAAVAAAADAAAREAVRSLPGAGVFGIEMTVDAAKQVLVHAVAPRVHNTGHYTIEACRTSQYEQHVRAVSGLELGETTLLYAAVTVKLYGPWSVEGVESTRSIPGTFVHLYGPRDAAAPRRVSGHVTLTGVNHPSYADALVHRADSVRRMIILKESKP
jgi:5-(carboxyamino)imidazole ribonucleotide synthase